MDRAKKKDWASFFKLFMPKWSCIKNSKEIRKWSNNTSLVSAFTTSANAQLSNSNHLKLLPKGSLLSLVHNGKEELGDLELVTSFETDVKDKLDEEPDLVPEVFAMEADQSQESKKKIIK